MSMLRRIGNLFTRGKVEREIDAELRAHIEMRTADNMAQGMTAEEARRDARVKFGNPVVMKEKVTGVDAALWMENLWRDVRYAVRQLKKSPGFTMTAIAVLALGIGANTAMFTVVDAVLLRGLPYADAGRLMTIRTYDNKDLPNFFGVAYPDIAEWQKRARSLSGIAYTNGASPYIQGPNGTEKVTNTSSSANLFAVLGVQPQLGRTYNDAEQTPGRDKVVVLSDALWEKLFHRDPEVLGKTVKLDETTYTVIGVMPKEFSYPFSQTAAQVWTPEALVPGIAARGNWISTSMIPIARLRPGVSMMAAQTELDGLQHGIAKEYPAGYAFPKSVGVRLESYRSSLVQEFRPALLMLLAACGLLWLIACANVASLMLVRGTVRQRELAVRQALGASRKRLVWQSLLDSMLLSLGGAAVGLGLALTTLWVFHAALMQRIDMLRDIHLNGTVLGLLIGFSVLTALVFGGIPAWLASRGSVTQALQQGGTQASSSSHQKRLRDVLMVGEIALSLTLLVACGLLLRTLYALRHLPLGIHTEHVIMADLTIPGYRYRGSNVVTALYEPMLEKTQRLPDVMAASLSTTVPLDTAMLVDFFMSRKDKQSNGMANSQQTMISAQLGMTSPEMQRVFGFRMLQGRFFDAQDTATSQPVAIVNRAFAEEWWPGSNPIGKQFMQMRLDDKRSTTIVIGVMDDLPQVSLADKRGPQTLLCLPQLGPSSGFYGMADVGMELAVRTRENPAAVIPEIRTLLGQMAPELRGAKVRTMDQVVEDSLGNQKLAAHLLEIFGGTALLITLAGLYGSLLYMVSLRNREMAIRMALGAQRVQVMRLVLAQAAVLLMIGLGMGMAMSYATGRFLRGYLYGVRVHDQWTLVAVSVLFAACGGLAAYIPARRAARVDPMQALRSE
jgi:predicted permease